MTASFRALLASLFVATACAERVGDSTGYGNFVQLDFPGSEATAAQGINDAGHIVGWYLQAGAVRGFILRDGVYTSFEYPGADLTRVNGLGPNGEIVGTYRKPGEGGSDSHGFVRKTSGEFMEIKYPGYRNTIAWRVLADGTVLGCYHGDDFRTMQGIAVTPAGIAVVDAPESMHSGATPDGATIVGFEMRNRRAYVIHDGALTLFDAPGSVRTEAWDINASGVIVGLFADSTSEVAAGWSLEGVHGFVRERERFATIDYPGATSMAVFGINGQEDIVGTFVDAGGQQHGFRAGALRSGR